MRFTSTLFAGAALIAAAFAVDIFDAPFEVEAGKGYEITYGPSETAPTTFILRKGPSGTLANLTTLTNSATGGSYTWNVDRGLVSADDYALMIIQEGDANYWGPIKLTGGQGRSSSSVASSSATPTASSSSASAASTTGSASASSSASASNNSTVSSASLSSTGSATARSSPTGASTTTGSSGPPESTGAASSLGSSPLALVFGAVAAMAYLN